MKILFVSALLPYPLHSGGQVRLYNLLKRLSEKHEVTLFSFLRRVDERVHIKNLQFCKKIQTVYRGHAWQPQYIARSLLSTYPLLFSTYAIGEMKAIVGQELQREHYDLVHIEPSYVWPALPRSSLPVVVCEHNIEYEGYKGYVERFPIVPLRPLLMIDVIKLTCWERRVWQKATRIITVSQEDRDVIAKAVGGNNIDVVPNGVDLSEFVFTQKQTNTTSPIFLFVGNFSWHQNADAVTHLLGDVWPQLKNLYPAATLRIVGRRASTDLMGSIRAAGAQLLDGVEDIAKEYAKADILIAPIRIGSGSRYKILEAMASGLPVITTHVGAAGLDVESGRDVMVAETPKEYLMATQTLLSNQKLSTFIATSARRVIEKSYSWELIARELERVWESVCEK